MRPLWGNPTGNLWGMARPTKLTPHVHACIIHSIKEGAYLDVAAEAAGVSASTVRAWIRRVEQDPDDCGPEFVEFHTAYKKARAEAELDAVRVVLNAAPRSWQAAAWYLERTSPERWGRRQPSEPVDPANAPITLAGLEALMRVET
jgi:hypothetical protein